MSVKVLTAMPILDLRRADAVRQLLPRSDVPRVRPDLLAYGVVSLTLGWLLVSRMIRVKGA